MLENRPSVADPAGKSSAGSPRGLSDPGCWWPRTEFFSFPRHHHSRSGWEALDGSWVWLVVAAPQRRHSGVQEAGITPRTGGLRGLTREMGDSPHLGLPGPGILFPSFYIHFKFHFHLLLLKNDWKLPYDPAIPLLGTYPEKIIIEKDTCTPMFIVALFTKVRTWKQPRRSLTDEWIKKLWYIYAMEYYSVIKRNKFESVLVR